VKTKDRDWPRAFVLVLLGIGVLIVVWQFVAGVLSSLAN
jgi:hypothetical protein